MSRWAREPLLAEVLEQEKKDTLDGLEALAPRAIRVFEAVLNDPNIPEVKKLNAADKVLTLVARHKQADAAKKVGDAVAHKMLTGVELLARRAEMLKALGLSVPPRGIESKGRVIDVEADPA